MRKVLLSLLAGVCFIIFASTAHAGNDVKIGVHTWIGYEPLYLARDLSGLEARGIRLVEFPSASGVLKAFQSGEINVAAVTLDEALVLRQDNAQFHIILVMDYSFGADALLARPQISALAELAGKRIAVESDAVGGYIINRALEKHGMGLKDVKVIHVDVDAHEKAYLDGVVDAVVTFEPVRSKLLQAGARELFSSKDIPGEITDVLIASGEAVEKHPEKLKELVAAWFKALEYMNASRPEAIGKIASRMKITPAQAEKGYAGLKLPSLEENKTALSGENPSLKKPLLMLQRSMVESMILKSPFKTADILKDSFLP